MPQGWQDRLTHAQTETDVVEVARDFIAQFSPYEIAALPESCRPPNRVKDANDITEYAFTLVRHHCDNGEPHDYAAHRLTNFFSNAAVRLSKILHAQSLSDNDEADQQSA